METPDSISVALIGCGFIADQHVDQLRYLPGVRVVAVCDQEELMAAQLADRFRVPQVFTDAARMLAEARPQAVHITTPAQSHFPLAKLCLEAGCHVYLEKPFTETTAQAETLIALAREKQVRLTVGHNLQFSPEALRLRQLVRSGFLGGPPVHLESIQCFAHDDPTYGKAVLGDPHHWVRRLPGSLLQNLISHGVAKLAEFLVGEAPRVSALCFSSPFLVGCGQTEIVDEVRATIQDEAGTTAFFLFTTQLGAGSQELRLFGRTGNLVLDNTYRTVLPIRASGLKSYLRYFFGPGAFAREYARNSLQNMRQFIRHEFHMDYGMRRLMQLFYQAIRANGPDPIPMAEILRTSRIMEAIFAQMPVNRAKDGEETESDQSSR
ncbi:MAG: 4-carboxy-2-hydroxymuconate-6-semialdehyde dehydrogenase [Verrucomicrobia bacterium ADurb.Bin118]|nr:MAG: 4-carboxy-2-hydroxymuconate-6-semialdehyde dehydrogenase [Verrucomicrobia bacterium ADurb.Bin118]